MVKNKPSKTPPHKKTVTTQRPRTATIVRDMKHGFVAWNHNRRVGAGPTYDDCKTCAAKNGWDAE